MLFKNVLHDLKNWARACKHGIRLALIMVLNLENQTCLWSYNKDLNYFFWYLKFIEMYFMWFKGILILFIVHCRFTSHLLLFQDALTFCDAIALCYNIQSMALQNHVLFPRILMGCLWGNYESFIPYYFWLCFELNPWT